MSVSLSSEVRELDETPLAIDPVLGWRVWRLAREDGELRLRAVAHRGTWTPQEVIAARCSRAPHEGAPVESCTCGYYAASSIKELAGSGVFTRGVGVIGAIAMWGRLIEHDRGARSRFAYPARLRLVCALCLQQGSIVDPITVAQDTWLIPLCDRHWRSGGAGQASASAVQSDLLATYGVELLPKLRLPLASRRSDAGSAAGVLTSLVSTIFGGREGGGRPRS